MTNRDAVKEKRTAVLMGGLSAERDISMKTGNAVFKALQENGCNVVAVDVGLDLPAQLLWQPPEHEAQNL